MYDYNCPDCNGAKLQSDKNARKINEVIDQVNALIQVNNETVDFIEEKANEVVEEVAEIKVNEILGDLIANIDNIKKMNKTNNEIKTDRLHLINNWTENAYTQSYYRVKDGVCYVNVNIHSGNTTEQIVIADNLPKPISDMQIACCDSDGKSGVIELTINGQLRVKKLQSTKDTMCTFSYLVK